MRRIYIVFVVLYGFEIFFSNDLVAQTQTNFSSEIRFVNHLLSRGRSAEALFVLENIATIAQSQTDSINHLKGWILYGQKDLDASIYYLMKVSNESAFYDKSRFFAAYNFAYLNNTSKSLSLLNDFEFAPSSAEFKMSHFQLAGIALLDRRMNDFEDLANDFHGQLNFTVIEEQIFLDYYDRIANHKNRSPFVAGLLSAAVPGLGKIYAGKSAEGISGLLYVGAMVLTTWDFHNRFGARNPFFIISAGLSGVFYLGNIWGSVAAVNRVNKEFNYEMDQRILLDMHIPLRKLYP